MDPISIAHRPSHHTKHATPTCTHTNTHTHTHTHTHHIMNTFSLNLSQAPSVRSSQDRVHHDTSTKGILHLPDRPTPRKLNRKTMKPSCASRKLRASTTLFSKSPPNLGCGWHTTTAVYARKHLSCESFCLFAFLAHRNIQAHTHTHILTHVHTHTHSLSPHKHTHIYTHTRTHTYTYLHTHTYTHTYTFFSHTRTPTSINATTQEVRE